MDTRAIKTSDYSYELPDERIAIHPAEPRDASKLLAYRSGSISDHSFTEMPDVLPKNALLVFNNTRVLPARLVFNTENGARIEVFCLGPADQLPPQEALQAKGSVEWEAFVGNRKRWKADSLSLSVGEIQLTAYQPIDNNGNYRIHFEWTPTDLTFAEVLEETGKIPLPPYIRRDATDADRERYQTMFARENGAVAAPTAALHFTDRVINRIRETGNEIAEITLHVGAGTFQPVKAETLNDHKMHTEVVHIHRNFLDTLLHHSGVVIPVGTTSMRTLETIYWIGVLCGLGEFKPEAEQAFSQWFPYEFQGDVSAAEAVKNLAAWMDDRNLESISVRTALLIAPGYQVKMCNGIVTNFHQPDSTLILLIAAIVGDDWKRIYQHALENDYRFLSYGDSSILLP